MPDWACSLTDVPFRGSEVVECVAPTLLNSSVEQASGYPLTPVLSRWVSGYPFPSYLPLGVVCHRSFIEANYSTYETRNFPLSVSLAFKLIHRSLWEQQNIMPGIFFHHIHFPWSFWKPLLFPFFWIMTISSPLYLCPYFYSMFFSYRITRGMWMI